jgi:FKBP-type peptidyl-prolyl cis-trans isomerase FkpA
VKSRLVLTLALLSSALLSSAACADRTGEDPPATEAAAPEPAGVAEPTFAPELEVSLPDMQQTPEGVHYRNVREGSGRAADAGATVTAEYRGWLPDGTLFEQRPNDEGFGLSEFVMGEDAPVDGLDYGMRGMRVGGIRRIVVPPEHGYGLVGRPAGVPAGSALVFEVRLVGVRQ